MAFVLSVGVALYTLMPVLRQGVGEASIFASARDTELMDAKERTLRAIKDLELDFAMGKLSQDDFESSRSALAQEASNALQELKRHGTQ